MIAFRVELQHLACIQMSQYLASFRVASVRNSLQMTISELELLFHDQVHCFQADFLTDHLACCNLDLFGTPDWRFIKQSLPHLKYYCCFLFCSSKFSLLLLHKVDLLLLCVFHQVPHHLNFDVEGQGNLCV